MEGLSRGDTFPTDISCLLQPPVLSSLLFTKEGAYAFVQSFYHSHKNNSDLNTWLISIIWNTWSEVFIYITYIYMYM